MVFFITPAVGRWGGSQGFDKSVQEFTDSGYTCNVYATGGVSEVKQCNQAGEKDENSLVPLAAYEHWGYTCREYKETNWPMRIVNLLLNQPDKNKKPPQTRGSLWFGREFLPVCDKQTGNPRHKDFQVSTLIFLK